MSDYTFPHRSPIATSEGHHDRCAEHIGNLRCTCDHERAWDARREARRAAELSTPARCPGCGETPCAPRADGCCPRQPKTEPAYLDDSWGDGDRDNDH